MGTRQMIHNSDTGSVNYQVTHSERSHCDNQRQGVYKPTVLARARQFLCSRRIVIAENFLSLQEQILTLPLLFRTNQGIVLHQGRNELREVNFNENAFVVKSFQTPHFINRLAYGNIRQSKAERSFLYAQKLRTLGIGSPEPVAWMTIHHGPLLTNSYYVCRKSQLRYTYIDLMRGHFPQQEKALRAIARAAARLHENGIVHNDFSQGNILFDEMPNGNIQVEFIDLNRLSFHRISPAQGCQNLAERLPMNTDMRRIVAEEYAHQRKADVADCLAILEIHPLEIETQP